MYVIYLQMANKDFSNKIKAYLGLSHHRQKPSFLGSYLIITPKPLSFGFESSPELRRLSLLSKSHGPLDFDPTTTIRGSKSIIFNPIHAWILIHTCIRSQISSDDHN